jgi:hypothetical protein
VRGTSRDKITPDYEAGKPIFWHAFKELSNNNNGLVSYYNLQERLVATGQFFVGEAVLIKANSLLFLNNSDQW